MVNINSWDNFELALPHPYYTKYRVIHTSNKNPFQLQQVTSGKQKLPEPLHNSELYFNGLSKSNEEIPLNINTPDARARRSLSTTLAWVGTRSPSIGQVWLIIYVLFSLSPEQEHFLLSLSGANTEALRNDLKSVGLCTEHPGSGSQSNGVDGELLVLRSMFWQGAGAPFGTRSAWSASSNQLQSTGKSLSEYPPVPLDYEFSNKFPTSRVFARHPIRTVKPAPGSIIYSRYIPHLKEHFSMVALDYENDEHLQLFHNWQNDPRVSAGWNETGTLDQHREYLRNLHHDKHIMTILAAFDSVFFAYFEVYWAKEDTLGAYYDASDYDRGRHSLVGDTRFRGPHRVSAWWSSLIHYLFLDEPRTTCIVGEPKATNSRVLAYDFSTGFNIEKFVDFPHKRSAFVKLEREKFFQIASLSWEENSLEESRKKYASISGLKL